VRQSVLFCILGILITSLVFTQNNYDWSDVQTQIFSGEMDRRAFEEAVYYDALSAYDRSRFHYLKGMLLLREDNLGLAINEATRAIDAIQIVLDADKSKENIARMIEALTLRMRAQGFIDVISDSNKIKEWITYLNIRPPTPRETNLAVARALVYMPSFTTEPIRNAQERLFQVIESVNVTPIEAFEAHYLLALLQRQGNPIVFQIHLNHAKQLFPENPELLALEN
jgi:hypothetical protein